MKKRFLASLLTVVTTMSLFVGCKKTDSTTEEIITELNEPVSIEMWHYLTGAQGEPPGRKESGLHSRDRTCKAYGL